MRTPDLLSDPAFHDGDAARAYLEEVCWPDGPFCPQCGAFDTVKPLGGRIAISPHSISAIRTASGSGSTIPNAPAARSKGVGGKRLTYRRTRSQTEEAGVA